MADQTNPIDAPETPRGFRVAVNEPEEEQNQPGTSSFEEESDREEYLMQLQSQLQEARDKLREYEQQRPSVLPTPAAGPSVPMYSMPPPMSVPLGATSQPQYFYMYPPPQPEQTKKCTYKQFLDCKPPEYSGSRDPTVTLNWLREVDRALDACQCEPELRVLYASRLFKGQAMIWWDSITGHLTKDQISSISWEQFSNKICEQYVSTFEVEKIRREFLELQMTESMSVDELIEQFNNKLRFVQQWVPDERSRVQHFVSALLPEYRPFVRSATTLIEAFMMAKMTESDLKAASARRRESFPNKDSLVGKQVVSLVRERGDSSGEMLEVRQFRVELGLKLG